MYVCVCVCVFPMGSECTFVYSNIRIYCKRDHIDICVHHETYIHPNLKDFQIE